MSSVISKNYNFFWKKDTKSEIFFATESFLYTIF
jgi:hypothetical protein